MKFQNVPRIILLCFFSLLFVNCSSDDDTSNTIDGSTPWENLIFVSGFAMNGQDFPHLIDPIIESTNQALRHTVCYSDLPTDGDGSFFVIEFNLFIPKHPTEGYLSGVSVNGGGSEFYLTNINGERTPNLLTDDSVLFDGVIDDPINIGEEFSVFNFLIPFTQITTINRDNFDTAVLTYFISYADADRNEIFRELRSVTVTKNPDC